MSRKQTLKVPQNVAGTDLRPVLTLLPVSAAGEDGGAEASDEGGKGATIVKGVVASAVVGHLAMAGLALKDAMAIADPVWDTAGVAKTPTLVKIVLVPWIGAAQFKNAVKPQLDQASQNMRLIGG